jgi:hypothetical protein
MQKSLPVLRPIITLELRMASGTLLNAVTTSTVGAGVSVTGDVEFQVLGDLGDGIVEIQKSIDNVSANYSSIGPDAVFRSPGWCGCRNIATNFFRAVLIRPRRLANATVKYSQ